MSAPTAFAAVGSDYIQDNLPLWGDVVNTGNYTSISVLNNSTLQGNIVNDGTLWPAPGGNNGIHVDASTIQGSIINNAGRQLTGTRAISLNGALITGDIVNEHRISGSYSTGVGLEVLGGSKIEGSIINNGLIQSAIVVNGGTVLGGIKNAGTIERNSDDVALDVSNAAAPMIITNTGTIAGNVNLGSSVLNMEGGDVTGAITGLTSILNVNGDFGATSKISVGQINVAPGKTLSLNNNVVKGLLSVSGTLAGSGEVGPTTLEKDATLSPSASVKSNNMSGGIIFPPGGSVGVIPSSPQIGTITVEGDLTFKPGSTYRVDATADGKSDLVKVNGTANLAGSVVHIGSGGTYAASTAYTILSATTINGHFDSLSSDLAYLQPSLDQQGNQIVLTLDMKQVPTEPDSKPIPGKPVDNGGNTGNNGGNTDSGTRPIEFADLAVTGNQRSAANAVQSLPKTSSLYTRVLNLPNGAPAGVFADLSGESFGSSVSAMQNVSNNVASLPTAQLRANMNAGFIPGPPTAQVGRGDASMLPRSNAQPLWAQAFGNWRSMDGNGNVGESFGSSVSAMQNVSNNVASLPTAQLRANMNAGFIPGPPTAQVGRGDASMLPRSNAQPLWAQAFGNWRSMDGNGNVAKSRERDVGIFVGGDHGVGNGWRLGGAFGYTDSRITVDDRSAKSDVNSYSAILYGGKSFEAGSGKINFTAGLAYTWHDIDSKRNINAAGQYQELKADYSASTGQVFTDVGYAIPLNDRVTLEPFFGADFSDLRTRGFSESGGDAALSGRSSTNNVGTTTLGLRAQTTFDVKDTAGRLRGMLGWRHAYGDVNPEATMSFDGSQPFTVAGNPLARDAAVMEVGVDLAMSKNATLGLAYSGQFGDGNRQNTGTVNVSWRF
ncbi:autotransporter outer membrane beta-barrel domain-containing protein [Achromobacter insolitus]|uniref:autotransporter family protein n=1 Tax=Achromobacter insolitus TaxID=217204 RepID=UPI00174BC72C|nr:autotransporter outer membrane beta-barrel domain-containing protein [Achromobacter insolitus]